MPATPAGRRCAAYRWTACGAGSPPRSCCARMKISPQLEGQRPPHRPLRHHPRIGRRVGDRWPLDASPTALVLAMDPENHFATAQQRAEERRKLQAAIREEVRYQDADISQDDLDILV